MRENIKKYSSVCTFVLGIFTVNIGYLAWCFFTISYKMSFYKDIAFFITIVTMLLYGSMIVLSNINERDREISKQFMRVSLIGGIFFAVFLISNINGLIVQKEYIGIAIETLWITVLLGSYFYSKKYLKNANEKSNIAQWWQERKWLCCLVIVTLFLMYDPDALQFKWDGVLYYLTCNELNVSSLSSLAIYGHIAQTYGMLNGIGASVINNTAFAMGLVNCSMTVFSICAFYGILKLVISGKREWVYVSFTAVYAWSPFLLGMVHYHNLDYLCQCFFPIVLFFLYKKQWVYFSLTSLLFCFTKEPAIIVYGAMCAGIVLLDWTADKEYSFIIRVKRLFIRKKYYLMVIPGVLWLATYFLLGPWSAGEGGFSIDWNYIVEKLKVLYVFNFNWVFCIIVIVSIIIWAIRRQWNKLSQIFPILCSQIAFTAFSCLFKTVNHPRYTDTNQVALYSMAIILLCCYNKLLSQIFSCVMAGLFLASSFYTIDPITKVVFPQYNIGSTEMVTTMERGIPLGDGMIYNRQMLGFERVINMALQDSLLDSDIVLFPTLENNPYFFDGMAEVGGIEGKYYIEQEYWNIEEQKRVPVMTEETKKFQVYHLTDHVNWNELDKQIVGQVNYFYLPFVGEEYAEEILRKYTVLEEEEYEYRGWILKRICFEME